MNDRAIIGIHGLLNKPDENTLQTWWRDAIVEGLRRNSGYEGPLPTFELAYWANVRNPAPIPLEELDEPYFAEDGNDPFERYDGKILIGAREIVNKYGGRIIDKANELVDLGKPVEKLLSVSLADLSDYYKNEAIRKAIRGKLEAKIEAHKDKDILLIGHSMGSIVAYDVLRCHDEDADMRIAHFVTIGSPLGLPYVCAKISDEFETRVTPLRAKIWTNVSDPRDKVALDCKLEDDYKLEGQGKKVNDVYINNTYKNKEGKANNHKSYGYLRAPEISDLLFDFTTK